MPAAITIVVKYKILFIYCLLLILSEYFPDFGFDYLFMVEIGTVIDPVGIAVCADSPVVRRKFRAVSFGIDAFVSRIQMRIVFLDIEPVFADIAAACLDNRLPVGNAHEDGRHEKDGVDAFVVECAQGVEPLPDGTAFVHIPAEILVQRVHRHGDAQVLHAFEQIHVT